MLAGLLDGCVFRHLVGAPVQAPRRPVITAPDAEPLRDGVVLVCGSTLPAAVFGAKTTGRLDPGLDADLVVLEEDLPSSSSARRGP